MPLRVETAPVRSSTLCSVVCSMTLYNIAFIKHDTNERKNQLQVKSHSLLSFMNLHVYVLMLRFVVNAKQSAGQFLTCLRDDAHQHIVVLAKGWKQKSRHCIVQSNDYSAEKISLFQLFKISLPTQIHVELDYSCCVLWRKVVHQHLACISYHFISKVSCKFTVQWRCSDKDEVYDVIQGSLQQWV